MEVVIRFELMRGCIWLVFPPFFDSSFPGSLYDCPGVRLLVFGKGWFPRAPMVFFPLSPPLYSFRPTPSIVLLVDWHPHSPSAANSRPSSSFCCFSMERVLFCGVYSVGLCCFFFFYSFLILLSAWSAFPSVA